MTWDSETTAAGDDQRRAFVVRNTCPNFANYVLRDRVVVLGGPFGVASGTAYGWLAKSSVAHTEHAKLSRQAIQIQADAVEVGI
jgi:hypothetical protein